MYIELEEIRVDWRASCTKEDAVAKLIGWMRGHIHPKVIEVTEQSAYAEQLPYRHCIHVSLQDELEKLREKARHELLDAMAASDKFDEFYEQYDAVERYDELIKLVAFYLVEITDEIAKGRDSLLRVDQQATDSTGVTHFTLKSVDQWARETYDIPILEDTKLKPIIPNSSGLASPQVGGEAKISNSSDQAELQQGEKAITQFGDDEPDEKGKLSRTASEHLYTSFALVVEAYAATLEEIYQLDASEPIVDEIKKKFLENDGKPIVANLKKEYLGDDGKPIERKFLRANGRPIVAAIANHVEEIAKKINENPILPKSKQKTILGQEANSIRKRISTALPIKEKRIVW